MTRLDTAAVLKLVMEKVGESGLRCEMQNPRSDANLPVCIVFPPLQRTRKAGAEVVLSFTVEVWAEEKFEVLRLFDKVRDALDTINLTLTNNTPLQQDSIGKWRFGGYFETRFNALINALERNR